MLGLSPVAKGVSWAPWPHGAGEGERGPRTKGDTGLWSRLGRAHVREMRLPAVRAEGPAPGDDICGQLVEGGIRARSGYQHEIHQKSFLAEEDGSP